MARTATKRTTRKRRDRIKTAVVNGREVVSMGEKPSRSWREAVSEVWADDEIGSQMAIARVTADATDQDSFSVVEVKLENLSHAWPADAPADHPETNTNTVRFFARGRDLWLFSEALRRVAQEAENAGVIVMHRARRNSGGRSK